MGERIIVIGAGMAGLWTTLALAGKGREIFLLDRDPPPPDGGADVAFDTWNRPGVGHLRHSHAFVSRLRILIRDEYPALLKALLDAGCRELTLAQLLPSQLRERYAPDPGDRDLGILTSRRTTLELVMRRYAETLPGVVVRSETVVKDLIIKAGSPPTVTGVVLKDGSELSADIVIDAAGRSSTACKRLVEAGVNIAESAEPCGILYFTRHYRLRPGQDEPPREGSVPMGDLGYLKLTPFPADNGCFSITLSIPVVEQELRKALMDPQKFDAICAEYTVTKPWVAPERSEPVSKVFGMGNLESRWRDLAPRGKAAVLGFFAVGDSVVRTNPLYGRGCTFAAIEAHLLRDALQTSHDPARQLVAYCSAVKRELRPHYEFMCKADRRGIKRAQASLLPPRPPTLLGKLANTFKADGLSPAIFEDPQLLRAFLRGLHMLDHPMGWLRRPSNVVKMLRLLLRSYQTRAGQAKPGPDRSELFAQLGISATADMERARSVV